jgi:hypothetical protein
LKILFLHQNFPGQFKHLAPALVALGHEVHALQLTKNPAFDWQGVKVHTYYPQRGSTPQIHPWVIDIPQTQYALETSVLCNRTICNPQLLYCEPGSVCAS